MGGGGVFEKMEGKKKNRKRGGRSQKGNWGIEKKERERERERESEHERERERIERNRSI